MVQNIPYKDVRHTANLAIRIRRVVAWKVETEERSVSLVDANSPVIPRRHSPEHATAFPAERI